MVDKVVLIKENDEIVGFRVNDKEFYAEKGLVEAEIKDLKGFNINSIPTGFCVHPLKGFDGFIYSNRKRGGYAWMTILYPIKEWMHKFGIWQYTEAMRKAIEIRKKINHDVEFGKISDDDPELAVISFRIFTREDMPIDEAIQGFRNTVKELEGHTERILEGEEISSEILKDETRFTIELLLPLFRSMDLFDVKYNHSKHEYGKDITFSEITQFGTRRNYGVQAKAGDLSGEAGSGIDKIIAQITDASQMSYIDTSSREKRFVSDVIIAISGRFTNNAEEKIIEKVHQRNIWFLSIDKIQELLARYMKKKIK